MARDKGTGSQRDQLEELRRARARASALRSQRAEQGQARILAKPGLESTDGRPRDYSRPKNPYRPTPQEERAAVGQLRSQTEAARFSPSPLGEVLMKGM